jgi:hypothetical protein
MISQLLEIRCILFSKEALLTEISRASLAIRNNDNTLSIQKDVILSDSEESASV